MSGVRVVTSKIASFSSFSRHTFTSAVTR